VAIEKKIQNEALMQRLADLDDQAALEQIHQQAQTEVGQFGDTVVAAREEVLKTELASYKKIHSFDNVVMNFAANQAAVTASFNQEGYAGNTYQAQQQVPFPEKAGGMWVKGAVNHSPDGAFSGSAGFNYVAPAGTVTLPGTSQRVDYVPIASLGVNVPASGSVNAENVTGLLGVVVKEHDNDGLTHNVNHTIAVVGNTQDADAFYRASKQFDIGNGYSATGYGSASYGTAGKLNLGAGVQLNKDLHHGYGASLQAEAGVADAAGNSSLSGALTARFTWGGPDKKGPAEEMLDKLTATKPLETPPALPSSALVYQSSDTSERQHAVINTSIRDKVQLANTEARMEYEVDNLLNLAKATHIPDIQSNVLRKAYELYKALDEHPRAQQQFMAHMCENLAKAEPDSYPSAKAAQQSLQASFEQWGHVPQQQPSTDMSHG